MIHTCWHYQTKDELFAPASYTISTMKTNTACPQIKKPRVTFTSLRKEIAQLETVNDKLSLAIADKHNELSTYKTRLHEVNENLERIRSIAKDASFGNRGEALLNIYRIAGN